MAGPAEPLCEIAHMGEADVQITGAQSCPNDRDADKITKLARGKCFVLDSI